MNKSFARNNKSSSDRNCKIAAETALKKMGRPATAMEIAATIEDDDFLRKSVGGITPHKTIQARLSTDIRTKGPSSKFYRYAPATFGLRELAENGAYSSSFRKIFVGRDRKREIDNTPVLCLSKDELRLNLHNKMLPADVVPMRFWKRLKHSYINPRKIDPHTAVELRLFIVVRFRDDVICYEPTEYDEKNKDILDFSSIGLNGSIHQDDLDLFDNSGFGFENANVREVKNFFYFASQNLEKEIVNINYVGVISDHVSPERSHKIAVISEVIMSERFALSDTILGVTNLHWRSLRYIPNAFADFDSWSQFTFRFLHERLQTKVIQTHISKLSES